MVSTWHIVVVCHVLYVLRYMHNWQIAPNIITVVGMGHDL